jgi:hypothetical protein
MESQKHTTWQVNYSFKHQSLYWKQRGKIKWIKEGEVGTKFFHAHATMHKAKERYNFILPK